MANLTVRRNQQGGGGGGALAETDPFRMVRESMRRMQDLFRDPTFDMDPIGFLEMGRLQQFVPDFEVRETQDGLVFSADLPGVKEDDVEITVVGNRLRISGKREFEQENRGDTWYAAERSYGNFTRTFILPEGADTSNVNANLANGVLTIQIGKRAESQPRRVALGGQQQQRTLEGQYTQGPFQQSQAGQPQQGQQFGQQQGEQSYNKQEGAAYSGEAGAGTQAAGGQAQSEQERQAQKGKVPEKV